MRTFVLRARKASARPDKLREQIGGKEHVEVIAHAVMNAFFISNGFREEVDVYIILDSSEDFPRTIHLIGAEGLSIAGFHENAIIDVIEHALKNSIGLQKDETRTMTAGVTISGFGFEKLIRSLLATRPVYLLDRKGDDIRATSLENNPVFVLSDHLAMPSNIVKSFIRQGARTLSLGKKMLFASQCIVIINHELDLQI